MNFVIARNAETVGDTTKVQRTNLEEHETPYKKGPGTIFLASIVFSIERIEKVHGFKAVL